MQDNQPVHSRIFPNPFARVINIEHPTRGKFCLLHNALTGSLSLMPLEKLEFTLDPKNVDSEERFEILRLLLRKGIYTTSVIEPGVMVDKVNRKIEKGKEPCIQFGFILDGRDGAAYSVTDLGNIFAAISAITEKGKYDKVFFHLWLFGDDHFQKQKDIFKCIEEFAATLPKGNKKKRELRVIVNTDGLSPIYAEGLRSCSNGEALVKFVIDDYFDKGSNGHAYVQSVIDSIVGVGEFRIPVGLLFNIRRGNKDLLLNDYFHYIMESGVFLTLIQTFYYIVRKDDIGPGYFLCEYDNIDWDFLEVVQSEIHGEDRLELFKLFGAGILGELENLIYYRLPLKPDVYFCPISRNALIFDGQGGILACPKGFLLDPALGVVGTYHPGLELKPEKVHLWHNRSVTRIQECSTCLDRFLCSGGCPFEAATIHGDTFRAVCQDISQLLHNEVYFNLEKLLEREARYNRLRGIQG